MALKNFEKYGGPAFPPQHDPSSHEFGLTAMEWYAGMALIALGFEAADNAAVVANTVFDMAEAMVAEAESRKSEE